MFAAPSSWCTSVRDPVLAARRRRGSSRPTTSSSRARGSSGTSACRCDAGMAIERRAHASTPPSRSYDVRARPGRQAGHERPRARRRSSRPAGRSAPGCRAATRRPWPCPCRAGRSSSRAAISKSSNSGPQFGFVLPGDRVPAAGLLDEVQDRGLVARRSRGRSARRPGRSGRAADLGCASGTARSCTSRCAATAVRPVDLVAVGDVQAARLHRGVAVHRRPSACPSRRGRRGRRRSCRPGRPSSCSRTATGSARRRCGT